MARFLHGTAVEARTATMMRVLAVVCLAGLGAVLSACGAWKTTGRVAPALVDGWITTAFGVAAIMFIAAAAAH